MQSICHLTTHGLAVGKIRQLQRQRRCKFDSYRGSGDASSTVTEVTENAALRQELSRRAACAHDALEKKFDEFGLFILRAIEERFGGRRLRPLNPDARRTTLPPVALPKQRHFRGSRRVANEKKWKGRSRRGRRRGRWSPLEKRRRKGRLWPHRQG